MNPDVLITKNCFICGKGESYCKGLCQSCYEKNRRSKTQPLKRKIKQEKCLVCGKIGVYCKGLCQACYSKRQRETPNGKLKQQIYNTTKGRAATKRFRDKQPKKERKLRERKIKIETLCSCGKIAVVKGVCFNCYQRAYQRLKYNYKPREKKEKKQKLFDSVIFYDILDMVKRGSAICHALKKKNIDRGYFYKNCSAEQKRELKISKLIKEKIPIEYEELYYL